MELINNNCENLCIKSDALMDFYNNPNEYLSLVLDYNFNCCETKQVILTQDSFSYDCCCLTLNSSVFEKTKFENSILKTKFTLTNNEGQVFCEQVNLFLDCDLRCRIFKSPLSETDEDTLLMHYTLTSASNCEDVEQKDMCDIFFELDDIVNEKEESCGC